jgi:signal transduction histidine kinase
MKHPRAANRLAFAAPSAALLIALTSCSRPDDIARLLSAGMMIGAAAAALALAALCLFLSWGLARSEIARRKAEEGLVHSERMATLGRMVASVAHDVNTSVGVCISAVSFLEDELKKTALSFADGSLKRSELERYLASAAESVEIASLNLQKAAELVQSFKRISVDRSNESAQAFRLRECIDQTLVSLRPRLRRGPYEVEVDCDPALEVVSNPGAVSQILTNLVENALVHAFEGRDSGTIAISADVAKAANLPKSADAVILRFSDNGVGMDRRTMERAFDPFFTTRADSGGTGLGLTIVRESVERALGGTIECESEIGKGTRFVITFPKIAGEAQGGDR